MTFTQENTAGYTDAQLAEINDKWADVVERRGLEDGTDEYHEAEDRFDIAVNRCDHVAEGGVDWAAVYALVGLSAPWIDAQTNEATDAECQGCYAAPCRCLPDDACCDPE